MTIAWDIDQLVKDYKWTSSGHFFDKDTMRFFKSKTTSMYKRIDDTTAYFVTTEKKCFDDETRVFNLRKATLRKNDNGFYKINIESIGTYGSRYLANKALKGI